MSTRRNYTIHCDVHAPGCYGWSAPKPTAVEAREEAAANGWHQRKFRRKDRDVCPSCYKLWEFPALVGQAMDRAAVR